MYYSLATATDTVSRLCDNDVEKRKDSIKKQLYYYRESLKIIKTEEFNVADIKFDKPINAQKENKNEE